MKESVAKFLDAYREEFHKNPNYRDRIATTAEVQEIAESHLVDFTEIPNGFFDLKTQQAISKEAGRRLGAIAAKNADDDLRPAWAKIVRDFHTARYWGHTLAHEPDPKLATHDKPKKSAVGGLIRAVFMSLVILKSFVMWMGAWYAEDPTPRNLALLLFAIALSVTNLVFFAWKYQQLRRKNGVPADEK